MNSQTEQEILDAARQYRIDKRSRAERAMWRKSRQYRADHAYDKWDVIHYQPSNQIMDVVDLAERLNKLTIKAKT